MELRPAILEPLFSYFPALVLHSCYLTCRSWKTAIDGSSELTKKLSGKVSVVVQFYHQSKAPSKEFTTDICIWADWVKILKETHGLEGDLFSVRAPDTPHGQLYCVNQTVKGTEIASESVVQLTKSMISGTCAIDRNGFDEYDIASQASGACDRGYLLIQGACKHVYHANCIERWCKTRNVCPLCNTVWEATNYECCGPMELDSYFLKHKIIALFKQQNAQTQNGVVERFKAEASIVSIKRTIESLIEDDWIERGPGPQDLRLLH